jgi:hypothetical protein
MSKNDKKESLLENFVSYMVGDLPKIRANDEWQGMFSGRPAGRIRLFCSRGIDFPAPRCIIYDMTGL